MKHGIRRRLIVLLAAFTTLLGVVFSALVFFVFWGVEDRFMRRQLAESLDGYQSYEITGGTPTGAATGPVVSERVFVGRARDLPSDLARHLEPLVAGYHEVELDDAELHALARADPEGDGLVVSLARFEESERTEKQLALAIAAGVGATVLAGVVLGALLARRVVAPVERLKERLEAGRFPLAEQMVDDEIGVLARALDDAMARRKRTLERERLFLREASHELRTPITVIQGACDLLREEGAGDGKRFAVRLERIARSVRRMNSTVQSLLWMAREERRRSVVLELPFAVQLADLVEESRLLLPSEVVLRVDSSADLDGSEGAAMLIVALANLLRNAVEHTEEGEIQIAIDDAKATVTDTGCGLDTEMARRLSASFGVPPGPGLGLPIVHRICRRFGWSFELTSEPGQGSLAQINFALDSSNPARSSPSPAPTNP